MLYLITYAITNFACFGLSITGAPNFRPKFKYVHSPLLGIALQGSFRPGIHVCSAICCWFSVRKYFSWHTYDMLLGIASQGSFRHGFHTWLTICCWVSVCRYFSWHTALGGFLGCVAVMFLVGYDPAHVHLHPNGGQFDFARSSARAPHGGQFDFARSSARTPHVGPQSV